MTAFPARGQKAPAYWDTQLKAYIDENDDAPIPSSQVSDFLEAVQDAVGGMIVAGTNVTLSYNDSAGTLTVTSATGADAEVVRDTIGAAIVGINGVVVTVNDAADTITLSISGLTISQVTGLQAALDLKQPIQRVAATVTASGVAVVNKHNPVDASGGARSLSLPTGQPEGTEVSVEKADVSVNTVSITGSIRGGAGASITLTWTNETVVLRADSTGSWWPYAGHKTKAALDAAYGPQINVALPVTGVKVVEQFIYTDATVARPAVPSYVSLNWTGPAGTAGAAPTNMATGDTWDLQS